jgi:GNAT superfamily N-acetyltransferase
MLPPPELPPSITLRTTLRPGDVGAIVQLHGSIYAREQSFDPTFEAYVAGPLAEFVLHPLERQQLWIAERDESLVGCIAIVAADEWTAQLRWFLVTPAARGVGLGRRLIHEAIAFSRMSGYDAIILWTVSALTTAARLYEQAGFRKTEEHAARRWGVNVVEEKYELQLR